MFIFVVFCFALAYSPIIFLWSKYNDLKYELEQSKIRFESEVAALSGAMAAKRTTPAVAPAAVPEPVQETPEPEAAKVVSSEVVGSGAVPEPVQETPEPEVGNVGSFEALSEPEPVAAPAVPSSPAKTEAIPQPLQNDISESVQSEVLNWEYWLGSRGAALLGGIVLALAGLFLFKYSLDRGLITPSVRVLGGAVLGLCSLAASVILRRTGNSLQADTTAGGGIVALYGAVFAATTLYHMMGVVAGFVLMSMITALGGWSAARYRSAALAWLGMAGGFATPILISTHQSNLVFLYGYLFLLNLGFHKLADHTKNAMLSLAGGGATLVYLSAMILGGPSAENSLITLAAVLVFCGFYSFGLRRWERLRYLQMAGMIAPFLMILTLNLTAQSPLPPFTTGTLAVVLILAALYQSRKLNIEFMPVFAAIGGLFLIHGQTPTPSLGELWFYVLQLAQVIGIYIWFIRTEPKEGMSFSVTRLGGVLFALLSLFFLPVAFADNAAFWPWILATFALLIGVWISLNGRYAKWPFPLPGLMAAVNIAICLVQNRTSVYPHEIPLITYALVVFGSVAAVQGAARFFSMRGSQNAIEKDGLMMAIVLGCLPVFGIVQGHDMASVCVVAVLAVMAVLGTHRMGSGVWYSITVLVTSIYLNALSVSSEMETLGPAVLLIPVIAAALLTMAPFFLKGRLKHDGVTWVGAVAAAPFSFFALLELVDALLPNLRGLAAVLPGLIALSGAWVCYRDGVFHERERIRQVWFAGIALTFFVLAPYLQFTGTALTYAWAIQSLLIALLWRKVDHDGLRVTSIGLALMVTLRLTHLPLLAWTQLQSQILSQLDLIATYLVPTALMLLGARVFQVTELARMNRDPWFRGFTFPLAAVVQYGCAVLALFIYLNLAVLAFYQTGEVALSLERLPARDLTLSIVWILYAVGLLAIGVRMHIATVRRVSLGFLMLAVTKVFLYDLGELTDLYRVASLLGLAVSLMAISVVYRQLVMVDDPSEVQA